MAQPVELVPLLCIKCNTAIPATPGEVAWVCGQCGQGMLLNESRGLLPLQVSYSAGLPPNARGKPYWVVQGTVAIAQRKTYGGSQEREAQQFWAQPRLFAIPAFECPLETILDLGGKYLLRPPALQPGPAAPFDPVVLPLEDVIASVDFIVMAVEANRKDRLQKVDFSVSLSTPALWILP